MEAKTSRIDIDTYFMLVARVVSLRSTCKHREQGVVIVQDKRIFATGYNGSPPNTPHCIDLKYCAKELGQSCRAEGLHGESNAIASAAREGVPTKGATIYCLYSPCRSCCNLLRSAWITEVKFLELYDGFKDALKYLRELGVNASKIKKSEVLSWNFRQA